MYVPLRHYSEGGREKQIIKVVTLKSFFKCPNIGLGTLVWVWVWAHWFVPKNRQTAPIIQIKYMKF